MQTVTEIRLDLKYPELTPPVHAKQNDQMTRYVKAYLYDGNLPFEPPEGTLAVFRAKKPDGTVCFYDANEANEPAVVLAENSATVELTHQVLAAPGTVQAEISLYTAQRERLTSFSFAIQVQRSALPDDEILSSDYYNILTEQIAQVLDAAKEVQGAVQEVTDAAGAAQESIRHEGQSQLEAVQQAGEQQTAAAKAEADRAKEYADSIDPSQFVKTVNGALPDAAGNVEIEVGSGDVTSVFGRSGAVAAQVGDYNADQIAETEERVFVSPGQRQKLRRLSGENILINGYLASPINQRNQTSYQDTSGTGALCIDHWWITNHTIASPETSPEKGELYLNYPADTAGMYVFLQKIENFAAYRGKTLTFSMLFKNLTGSVNLQAQFQPDYTGNIVSSSINSKGLLSLTFTVPEDAQMLWVCLVATEIVPFYVKAVAAKLELGEEQTLARQEGASWTLLDPPPDPALELAKCQRYYQKKTIMGMWQPSSATAGSGYYFFPYENNGMRVTPTVLSPVDVAVYGPAGWNGTAAMSIQSNRLTFTVSNVSGQTANTVGFIRGTVTLDAEMY